MDTWVKDGLCDEACHDLCDGRVVLSTAIEDVFDDIA